MKRRRKGGTTMGDRGEKSHSIFKHFHDFLDIYRFSSIFRAGELCEEKTERWNGHGGMEGGISLTA